MKKLKQPKVDKFIIVNQSAQVFSGLSGGYPKFSENWDEARPLENIKQFDCVKRGTIDKLEIMYL